jgi:hypothetical protein
MRFSFDQLSSYSHVISPSLSPLSCALFQLRRLSADGMSIELDAIICVIDAINFPVRERALDATE